MEDLVLIGYSRLKAQVVLVGHLQELEHKEPSVMKQLESVIRVLAVGVLVSGLAGAVYAQDKNQQDRMKETAITGCLNKDASGGFVISDEKTGAKTVVTGAELEKHSANHKVTLTGTAKTDPSGKATFEASKVTMVSASCQAPQ
jgi:hypothetical protein